MLWSVNQSYSIELPEPVLLEGEPLSDRAHVAYLGSSLGPRGVTDHRLIDRINAAITLLLTIMRVTSTWNTTMRQRTALVKTFVYSLTTM